MRLGVRLGVRYIGFPLLVLVLVLFLAAPGFFNFLQKKVVIIVLHERFTVALYVACIPPSSILVVLSVGLVPFVYHSIWLILPSGTYSRYVVFRMSVGA